MTCPNCITLAARVDQQAEQISSLRRDVHRLAEHLGVDLLILELHDRPTMRAGTPASWDEMLGLGLDPVDGSEL